MIQPIPIETTEVDKLKQQVDELSAVIIQKEVEVKQERAKRTKRPSIGYFRSRFK